MQQDNLKLIARLYEAMDARDMASIAQMIDPEVSIYQTDLLPWGGRYHGLAGLAEFYGKLTETIDSAVETGELVSAGECVVQIGRTRGRVKASGAEFDVREVHVWELRDGKVLRFEAHIDTPAMLEALQARRAQRSG